MSKTKLVVLTILVTVIVSGIASGIAFGGPSGGDFEITKNTIDNGGGTSTGGDFSLTGTIGQHDASVQPSQGGNFVLAGGFWANAFFNDSIFADGFEDL